MNTSSIAATGDELATFRAKRETFDTLFRSNVVGINIGDLSGRIFDANDAFLRMIGYSRDDLVSGSVRWDDLAAPESRDADVRAMDGLQRIGYSQLREKVYVRKDGGRAPALVGVTLLEEADRSVAVVVDLTRQQQILDSIREVNNALETTVAERTADLQTANQMLVRTEHELRRLAAEKFFAEEMERRRIAAGLHDRVAQSLALARMRLNTMDLADAADAEAARDLVVNELGGVMSEVRSLIFELNPPQLYDLAFGEAIESLAEEFARANPLECRVRIESGGDSPLADAVRAALFSSVRELLQNVVRHAQVDRATITLRANDEMVTVEVRDEGPGLTASEDRDSMKTPRGYGIFSIRDRLAVIGGRLELESQPGRGVIATLRGPLQK